MKTALPSVVSTSGERSFACFPAAVLVLILNDNEQALLLSRPDRPGRWEVVSGALKAHETVLDGVMRETQEELGCDIEVRPIGALHAQTFDFDTAVRDMISIVFVSAYVSGEVQPGDDLVGSKYQWANIKDIVNGNISVIVPQGQIWLFERALDVFKLWQTKPVDLQKDFLPSPYL